MKFTFATIVALFAAQALATAVADGEWDKHDKHDDKTVTVTEYKTKYIHKTETEYKTKYKKIFFPKKIYKTITETETKTKKWCPKKHDWKH